MAKFSWRFSLVFTLCFSLLLQYPFPLKALETTELAPDTQTFVTQMQAQARQLDAALRGDKVTNPYDIWDLTKQTVPSTTSSKKLEELKAKKQEITTQLFQQTVDQGLLGETYANLLRQAFNGSGAPSAELNPQTIAQSVNWATRAFVAAKGMTRETIESIFTELLPAEIKRLVGDKAKSKVGAKFLAAAEELDVPDSFSKKMVERIVDLRLEVNMGLRGHELYKDRIVELQAELERLAVVDKTYDELVELNEKIQTEEIKVKNLNGRQTDLRADRVRAGKLEVRPTEGGQSFDLYNNGELVHHFDIPTTAARISGDYLLFLKSDSYNAQLGLQNVSVADLKYFRAALGRTSIPIFNIPVESSSPVAQFIAGQTGPMVGTTTIDDAMMEFYCRQQILFFNIAVNLLDPKLFKSSAEMVSQFTQYWNRGVELGVEGMKEGLEEGEETPANPSQKALDSLQARIEQSLRLQLMASPNKTEPLSDDLSKINRTELTAITNPALQEFKAAWQTSSDFQGLVQKLSSNMEAQTKLTARMRLIWNRLTIHRPMGAPTIVQAMGMVAGGVVKPWNEGHRQKFKNGTLGLWQHPYARLGLGVAGAATLANFCFPEAFTHYVHQSLDMVTQTAHFFWGKAGDVGYLAHNSFNATFEGFNPTVSAKRYLSDWRTAIGVGGISGIFAAVIFIPHVIVNSIKVAREIKDPELVISDERLEELLAEKPLSENQLWQATDQSFDDKGEINQEQLDNNLRRNYAGEVGNISLRERFVSHQNRTNKRFLRALAEDMTGQKEENGKSLSAEDRAKTVYIAENGMNGLRDPNVKPHRIRSWLGGAIKKLQACFSNGKSKANVEIESFGEAVSHFVMSWATFTNTLKAYTSFWWDGYFVARNYVPFLTTSPKKFIISPFETLTFLVFPNYYSTSMSGYKNNSFTQPTHLNGGTRTLPASLARLGVRAGAAVISPLPENVQAKLASWGTFLSGGLPAIVGTAEHIRLLDTFERAIIPVERLVQKAVLEQSVNSLIGFTNNDQELLNLVEEGGIQSITDDGNLVTGRSRAFFHSYSSRLMGRAMELYMEDLAKQKGLMEEEELTMEQLKDRLAFACEQITITEDRARVLVDQAAADPEIFKEAVKVADEHGQVLKRVAYELKSAVLKGFDLTKNPHLKRVATVRRQMDKPAAMARAVRASVSALIVDKPMELVLTFVMLAGINDGILNPITDQFMGPNSFMYVSRYVFMYGFLWGSISGLIASPGLKLMQDVQHDANFGEQPDGKYRKTSMLRYFLKNFTSRDNTWWGNQTHNMKIAWINMKAALVNMTILGLVFMGRLDWDLYVVGYMMCYLSPFDGFAFKVEQAFELAVGYWLKDIPKRLQGELSVQKMYQGVLGVGRASFNLFYKVYENIMGGFLGNFESMTTDQFGKRSLSKILTGGSTFTQLSAEFLQKVAEKTAGIPLVPHLAHACEKLITNNFTDWVKK
ncbi:MAG: hypothetical protein WCG27_01775 [Pseudomonadota bacterium]